MCMHYADALLFRRTILYEQKNVKLILYPMFACRQYTCSKTLGLNRLCLLTQVKCVSSVLQRVRTDILYAATESTLCYLFSRAGCYLLDKNAINNKYKTLNCDQAAGDH